MQTKVNKTVQKHFYLMDGSTPVTGKSTIDFAIVVTKDTGISGVSAIVAEVNSGVAPGLYSAQVTPNATGNWFLSVKHPTYTMIPMVVSEDIQVLEHDDDDIFAAITRTPPGDAVLVGTDYGGVDNLRYKDLHGTGIADAEVRVYLKTDYDAGNLGQIYVKATTRTDINGRLVSVLPLSPNYWYKIAYVKPGYPADVKELFVS